MEKHKKSVEGLKSQFETLLGSIALKENEIDSKQEKIDSLYKELEAN